MDLADPEVQAAWKSLPPLQRLAQAWRLTWLHKALRHQVLPPGDWWSTWLMLAGRGAGKTRTASEQIAWWAWSYPKTRWLVAAPTSADVRGTCFEGDSGLISVIPPALIQDYNKALHEIVLANGSLIKGIPASEPERFRGPQFAGGWCCIPGTLIDVPGGLRRPIEDLRRGDLVMTRHGPRKVLAAGISGNPAGLVALEIGETSLTLTEDHPILIGDRWVPAGDVKEGDLAWVTSTSAQGTRTELFMRERSAQYLPGGSFTTRTETRRTTPFAIWRRCQRAIISGFTQRAAQALTPKGQHQQKHLSLCGPQSRPSASSVKGSLFQRLLARLASSVPGRALRRGVATNSFQSRAIASFAAANISLGSDSSGTVASDAAPSPRCGLIDLVQLEVGRVERLPSSTTYNLTVEGEHEFIANGVVVHNCDELAAWDYIQEAWDQIQFGMRLRLPDMPTRLICTTTPRPKDLILELIAREGEDVVVTTASTYDNLDNLSDNFRKQILVYEGTKLGQQEIYAQILDPEEGGIIKREWFRLWPDGRPFPRFEYIIQSYDCATSERTQADPTACTTWGVFKPLDGPMSVMLIDAWQDHLQYPDLRPKVIEEYETIFGEGRDKTRVNLILIEDKSAGISLIQDLQRAHLPVRAYNPGRADKIQRLNIVSNIIARGRVWVPESSKRPGYVRDWAEGFVSQICSFPESTRDDFVDTASQALRFLRDAGWLEIDPPPQEDWDDDDYVDAGRVRVNPYAA